MAELAAKDIMTRDVVTVAPSATVQEVARVLSEKRFGGVPVVDDQQKLQGIVTESDLVERVAGPHLPAHIELLGGVIYLENPAKMNEHLRKAMALTAQEVMSHPVVTVNAETSVRDVADMMMKKRVNRLPVVSDGKLVGIITRHDVIATLQ